jgi:hypothetical protein
MRRWEHSRGRRGLTAPRCVGTLVPGRSTSSRQTRPGPEAAAPRTIPAPRSSATLVQRCEGLRPSMPRPPTSQGRVVALHGSRGGPTNEAAVPIGA